jgi:glycosyltransferase involved in cell wall biosynthesis
MSRENGRGARVAVLGIKSLPAFAGADRVVEHLLDRFSPENEYTVYLIRDGGPTLACTADRHYVYIPALKGKFLRAPSYFILCCVHYVLKGRYDIAHVHNSDFGVFCPLLKLKRGARVIGTFHGDPSTREKWNWLAKALLRASESVFVRACDTLTSVSADKVVTGRAVHYIPNGTDGAASVQTSGENVPYRDLALRECEYVMFACGRLDRTKGLHHLLEAYRELRTNARLLVVGDFSHDVGYSGAIDRAASADSRVVLHKQLLDQKTLLDALRRCAVFVFPSEVEGMSMMLLEALMSAKVVVCSDIPANLAVVGTDYPFLFASHDSSALRSVLASALDVSMEGWDAGPLRKRIAGMFSWDKSAAAYEELYDAGVIRRTR